MSNNAAKNICLLPTKEVNKDNFLQSPRTIANNVEPIITVTMHAKMSSFINEILGI